MGRRQEAQPTGRVVHHPNPEGVIITDASTTTVAPTPDQQKVADDIQPVLDAIVTVAPASEVEKVEAFLGKYAKGYVALAGTVATLAVGYLPVDSLAAHIAQGILGVATIAGVVIKRNATA